MSESTLIALIGILATINMGLVGWCLMMVVKLWGDMKAVQASMVQPLEHARVLEKISEIQERIAQIITMEPPAWLTEQLRRMDMSINDLKLSMTTRMTAMETQIRLLPCGTGRPCPAPPQP